jgi:type IV secretory pathway VirD2 relaxase
MTDDGEDRFRPKIGRIRSLGGKRAKTFLSRLAREVSRAGGSPRLSFGFQGGLRTGRGWSAGFARRVIVKARIVRLDAAGRRRQAAHLSYIQRDGVARDGSPARLYDTRTDDVDGRAFAERSEGDRHQFRFIVSPEDGRALADLKPFVRDLMREAERDLGTRLEWVAADHYDTDHPHAHVVVRGRTDQGQDLVIPRAYITHGLRRRAGELVTMELGPETAVEAYEKLIREETQERFTRLDRRLLAAAHDQALTLNERADDGPILAARLRRLERMGLAKRESGGAWSLDPALEPTLRRLGERGDIIKTLSRRLAERGLARPLGPDAIWDGRRPDARAFEGRLVAVGVADEHADRAYAIVDGLDGKARYVDLGLAEPPRDMRAGDLVGVRPAAGGPRAADRTIAAVAVGAGGSYDEAAHRAHDPGAREAFIRTHVRRLEALRREGHVERGVDGVWTIPADYLDRAAAHERAQAAAAAARIELLAEGPLAGHARTNGATWLDARLAGVGERGLAETGYGGEVRQALAWRRAWLVEQGLLEDASPGRRLSRRALADLRRRELLRVGRGLERELARSFVAPEDGERIEGRYLRIAQSGMGKLAVIERAHDFTLVPWREALERRLGQVVSGVLKGETISWDFTRRRGLGPT